MTPASLSSAALGHLSSAWSLWPCSLVRSFHPARRRADGTQRVRLKQGRFGRKGSRRVLKRQGLPASPSKDLILALPLQHLIHRSGWHSVLVCEKLDRLTP